MSTKIHTSQTLDAHPNVIGRATVIGEYRISFDGREYIVTSKSGNSIHDRTPVEEYHHAESGHRVWKDLQDRVHADSHSDAMAYRRKLV